MKRWDVLADRFLEGYSARGLADETVNSMRREWDRWGCWLRSRRPRPKLGHSTPTESGVYLHVLPGRQQKAVDCLEEDEEQKSNEDDQEDKKKEGET